jgi:hypothetical protein
MYFVRNGSGAHPAIYSLASGIGWGQGIFTHLPQLKKKYCLLTEITNTLQYSK